VGLCGIWRINKGLDDRNRPDAGKLDFVAGMAINPILKVSGAKLGTCLDGPENTLRGS